jgi:hypothetical protein
MVINGTQLITSPGDYLIIRTAKGVLSNSIKIESTKDKDRKFFSFKNCPEAWAILKNISEIEGRTVVMQEDDEAPVPFKESIAYKIRFTK